MFCELSDSSLCLQCFVKCDRDAPWQRSLFIFCFIYGPETQTLQFWDLFIFVLFANFIPIVFCSFILYFSFSDFAPLGWACNFLVFPVTFLSRIVSAFFHWSVPLAGLILEDNCFRYRSRIFLHVLKTQSKNNIQQQLLIFIASFLCLLIHWIDTFLDRGWKRSIQYYPVPHGELV